MERAKTIAIACFLAVGLLSVTGLSKTPSVLLQEALYTEEVEGDLDAAIKLYEQIIRDGSAARPQVAQAIYRQGMCYLKKQDEQRAKAAFERLTAEFADQTKIIAKVEPLLDELSNPDPAALMPPETLVYLEFGSPGKQVEAILKMLKGTPFENPLAAIGGATGQSQKPAGEKSPGEIIAALLNPSMMAEFKKIRGMAVGITGILANNPPSIAVLYPGKSDALRGVILAALGIVAQPGERIEGMETLRVENGPCAAYDDRVIIIAQPLQQLNWCIKQYKGITREPTFASNNRSFAKVSRQARQENAVTIWANADEVFAGLVKQFPQGELPDEIRFANAVADFKNIDDLVVLLSIQENGITFKANVGFKNGHNCLAYDVIRTPNLSKAGFSGVPARAAALVSLALAEPSSPGVAAAQKTVKKLTGLDIGREIFANIEQITLFAAPPEAGTEISGPPIRMVSCIGLALTSHDPQQTRQLLAKMLGIVDAVANPSADVQSTAQSEPATSKYRLPLGGDNEVYCYIGQSGKTTIVAFSPEALEMSLSAIKSGKCALTTGCLQEPLSQMTGDTSKLMLVNVGGVIRLADAYINMAYENPQNPAHKTLAQLAQACDRTSVQLRTGESVNDFSLHFSIDRLPPLDNVFPMLIQLSQTDIAAQAKATDPQPGHATIVGLKKDMKLNWKAGIEAASHKVYLQTKSGELSLLADVPQPRHEVDLPSPQEDTKYYWRVDEVWQDGTVITGDVWNFTIGKQVAWWKLDEADGRTAQDSAGDNNGTLVGNPVWKPSGGKVGGVLEFDGDGDCVEIADESKFDITQQITVAAWIKVNAFNRDWQAIVTKGDSAWRLQRNRNTNSLEFACTGLKISGTQWGNLLGSMNVNDGQWHHAAGVYDGTKLYLYVDGKMDNSVKAAGSINNNDERVYIGENSEIPQRFWNGLIDDVRIYNYALSEDEIAVLCRAK